MWCGRESVYLGSPAVRQNAGGQWLHILRDRPEWTPPPTPRRRKSSKGKSKRPLAERAAIAKRAAGRRLHELCEHLGVDVLAELRALGVGWFGMAELVELEPFQDRWKELPGPGVWTVPMKNSAGNVLGVQTRDDNRNKLFISGGESGLIFRDDFSDRPGAVWMPEGMSDTAAIGTVGLCAVGRPSNAAGAELLIDLLSELDAGRELVVVADRDAPKANGKEPGREGALATAGKIVTGLGRPVRVVYPPPGPWKDAKDWLAAHPDATAADWVDGVELIEVVDAPRDCTSPPAGDVVTLSAWRTELAARKVQLVTEGAAGVFVDRSPTGAGKSHSDALMFVAAGEGLSIQPTHLNCVEVVSDLRARGIDAGAAPEWQFSETLDKGNCWSRDARDARGMGLPIMSAACVSCSHRPTLIDKQTGRNIGGSGQCDATGYRGQLNESRKRAVRVVTHQRAAVEGMDALADEMPVVSIHENAMAAFRPECTFDPVDVDNARDVVSRMLNDPKSIDGLSDDQRVILDVLADGLDVLAAAVDQPSGPVALPYVDDFRPIVRRLFILSRAMRRAIPWGSILAAFTGNVSGVSCLLRERRPKGEGGTVETWRFFHVVHQNRPPKDALVIVSDATADMDALSAAVGDVVEITPPGRLVDVQSVRQVPRGVTRQTKIETVVKFISGRLIAHPEWMRVGIVCLKCHRPGLEQWQAAGGLGSRVHRIAHFQGGTPGARTSSLKRGVICLPVTR